MDTGWIQVFVLTLTQCIAPPGKMVCEEQSLQLQFADQVDCEIALAQLVDIAGRVDNVIVKRESSHCRAMTRQVPVFASAAEAGGSPDDAEEPVLASKDEAPPDFMQSAHEERLRTLHNCDEVAGVAPCKIGEIIIEAAENGKPTEIWRRQN